MELAINGGAPVRSTYLPYGEQWIDEDDIAAVVETLRSPFLTQGPQIERFERRIADFVNARHAVAFSNGTAALHAACFAAGIQDGDEVCVPPITFVASANCVLYCGGRPVFVDIDARTYNMDPHKLRDAITNRTKAVIAVDFTGQPADLDAIMAAAKERGLIVIEDAAHSLGAEYKGRRVGAIADMTMFSFHPVKHITSGEGGMVTTDSDELAAKLRMFRSHGIVRDGFERNEGPWYYEMRELGYNYRMTDIQAALGLSQMNKLERFLKRRREIAERYNEAFAALEGVIPPYQTEESRSAWHLYSLNLVPSLLNKRREIFDALRKENIGVHVHYIPVHLQPYYRETLGCRRGMCPIAEAWYDGALTIPLFPKMMDEDVESVIRGVTKVIQYYTANV